MEWGIKGVVSFGAVARWKLRFEVGLIGELLGVVYQRDSCHRGGVL